MRRLLLLCLFPLLLLTACDSPENGQAPSSAVLIPSLTWLEPELLDAAEEFTITRSQEGYTLVSVPNDDAAYLVIPEGRPVPEDVPETVTVLQQPISNIYLAASATMDMIVKLDAMDAVAFSALPADDWTIPEAEAAMEDGRIEYAGKYSAPDYERICSGDCGLAIENTMLYHSPEIREQLERFGVPVLVDHASHETPPWVGWSGSGSMVFFWGRKTRPTPFTRPRPRPSVAWTVQKPGRPWPSSTSPPTGG